MLQQTIITYDTFNEFFQDLPENIRQDTADYVLYLRQQNRDSYCCFEKLPSFLTLYCMPRNHIKTEEGVIAITSDIVVMYNDNNTLKQFVVGTQQRQEKSKEKFVETLTDVVVGAVREAKKRIQEEKLQKEALGIWESYMKKHC